MPKLERRKLTAREWAAITTSRPVVRRVINASTPAKKPPGPIRQTRR